MGVMIFLFNIKIKTDESTQKPVILDFFCIGVSHDIHMCDDDNAVFKSIKSKQMRYIIFQHGEDPFATNYLPGDPFDDSIQIVDTKTGKWAWRLRKDGEIDWQDLELDQL